MASGLPEKMSVTMVLAAIRRLQQRDCPGFSPDSLLITTHTSRCGVFYTKTSSLLRRCDVAVNQLRVQSYDKKMNFRITSCRFYLVICKFLPIFAKNYNINPFSKS